MLKQRLFMASTTLLLTGWQLCLSGPVVEVPVIAQTVNERKVEASQLMQQGLQYFYAGQPATALSYLQKALTLYQEIKDRRGEGQALGNLGLAYLQLRETAKAIEYLQQDLEITRELKDKMGEGQALGNLGLAYSRQGDTIKAVEYFEQSLEIARAINDPQAEVNALGNLGLIYEDQKNYDKAIEYYEKALAITQQINPLSEASALFLLGNTYTNRGNYDKAIEYLQKALVLSRNIKNQELEWRALLGIGNAFLYLGEYTQAIDYFQQSLEGTQKTNNKSSEGYVLNSFGNAYVLLADYAQAIEYFQQGLTIAQAINDKVLEGATLGGFGNTFALLGDYNNAMIYYQQSLAIYQELEDPKEIGTYLGNLGVNSINLEDYPQAIEYLQQSLAIARQIKDREAEGRTLGNLGFAYLRLNEYSKAIHYFQQDLEISQEIGNLAGQGRALNNLGIAYLKSGNLVESEKILHRGIEARESLRERLGGNDAWKVSIFEHQTNTYRILQEVLIAQNKIAEALEIAERGRARAFVELLTTRLSPARTTEIQPPPPTIQTIQRIAQDNKATLVQYSIITDNFKVQDTRKYQESALYIWVVKPTGEISFRQVDLKPLWQQENTSLNKLINTMRHSIGVDERSIFEVTVVSPAPDKNPTQTLQKLHQLLIEPIADLLPADPNERVIFIPQSELFLVPFPALQDQDQNYLIEKHTILTAPSIQVIDITSRQANQTHSKTIQNAIIVGNPTMPSLPPQYGETPQKLAPLPGAEREAETIAALFKTQALTGNAATKTAILSKLPQANIIHLATHGLFNDFQGLQSAIALAPTGTDPGFLTAAEILDLKLSAELVVLSACNTGRGKITGDGVIGLSRAFMSAGIPSIIVSLWSVPDAPTAELMSEFYTYLNQNQLDKAQALRQAMLTMMKKYPNNPRAWAAFTLIGKAE
jgi:CHAT domain-containing protein/tetratricopeptide (TPR) repeat protein